MRYERIHSIIEEHNADPTSTYKMGHNEFSVLVSFLIKKSWIIDVFNQVIKCQLPLFVILQDVEE
jgi:hypothetical protein